MRRRQGANRAACAGMPLHALRDLSREVSLLYSAAEGGSFIAVLRRFLSTLVEHDHLNVFCQRDQDPPELVWSSFEPRVIRTGVRNFIEATYVIDPFAQAFRAGVPPGAYRGADMAPYTAFSRCADGSLPLRLVPGEELGFLTDDWPENLAELQIVFPLGLCNDGAICCQVGLYRNVGQGTFSKADAELLTALTPLIAGAFTQYRARLEQRNSVGSIPACLALLSPRERSVLELVSQGFTSAAIGTLLQVSVETVKTHRKRAYRKLAISSQAELFALMRPAPVALDYPA